MTTVVGITGGSGSGKSTLARAVREAFGRERTATLSQDSYYRDLSHLPLEERARANFDAPAAVDLARLAEDVGKLASGRPATPPAYDMRTHVRVGDGATVEPAGLVLVEGTLLAAETALLAALDLLVFVDLPDDRRLGRRLRRDVEARGRTPESVREQWAATVRPMHELHVEPARGRADLVVPGDAPADESARRVLALLP